MDVASLLEPVALLARQAGQLLLEIQRAPHKRVLSEIGKDIKLSADRESESLILAGLAAMSSFPILTEETGEHGAITDDAPFWVVDPLDGTMNYFRDWSLCCVSIALWQGDHALLGVLYDFNRDELYTAVRGGGAFRNGERLRVSDVRDTGKAVLLTGFPSSADLSDAALGPYFQLIRSFKKVRMIGTAAMAAAFVASGLGDAYGEDEIHLWDIAAGVLLIEEAGGWVELHPSGRSRWRRHIRTACAPGLWPV